MKKWTSSKLETFVLHGDGILSVPHSTPPCFISSLSQVITTVLCECVCVCVCVCEREREREMVILLPYFSFIIYMLYKYTYSYVYIYISLNDMFYPSLSYINGIPLNIHIFVTFFFCSTVVSFTYHDTYSCSSVQNFLVYHNTMIYYIIYGI
jgi:hypothetical protein